MLYDLHIHSYYSDGTFSPEKIASICKERGINTFSITDHNLLNAYPEAWEAAEKFGLRCIPGVEIDCILKGKSYHVLGYGIDTQNQELLSLIQSARTVLDDMSDRLIAAIEKAPEKDFYPVTMKDYQNYENDRTRGGWKGLNYLLDRKLANDFGGVMALYSRYQVTYEKSAFPSMEDTCKAIRVAGGHPILAHPGEYFPLDEHLEENLAETVAAGVEGIECYYPRHSEEYRKLCDNFCRQNNLYITCGGDSHGNFRQESHGIRYGIGVASVDETSLKLW